MAKYFFLPNCRMCSYTNLSCANSGVIHLWENVRFLCNFQNASSSFFHIHYTFLGLLAKMMHYGLQNNWIPRFFGLKIIRFRVFPKNGKKMYSYSIFLMYSYSAPQKIYLFGFVEKSSWANNMQSCPKRRHICPGWSIRSWCFP